MSRSCLYCKHARVTLPVLSFLSGCDVECTARNGLYVIHPMLRALTCRGFKDKHRLRLKDGANEAR